VITVCDAAHEELAGADRLPDPVADRLHWSIPDPSRTGEDSAFDRVVTDLTDRIARVARVAPAVRPANPRRNTAGGPEVG
jgi:protein-tyrosine-phosphatase